MGVIRITGGNRLKGEITIESSKNSFLAILAASVLSGGKCTITNFPKFRDADVSKEILSSLGCRLHQEGSALVIDTASINKTEIPEDLSSEMRSTILFIGPVLARFGQVTVGYPGGCEIGPRPIDLHLKGLKKLGVNVQDSHGFICCKADELRGGEVHLDYPSVGATENIMMAAVHAKGTTHIRNAAKEPEIADLQNCLNRMGARISGAGTSTIVVEGVSKLHDTEYSLIPDRIVAGTYMCAAAITGGEICLRNAVPEHLSSVIFTLRAAGCQIITGDNSIKIKGPNRPKSIEVIRTLPYPGFPTDMQAPILTLMTIAKGDSLIVENIFKNRYKHVDELIRMGANIELNGGIAAVKGVKQLNGAKVRALDLRGGAALVLAGLAAEGETCIANAYQLDRGYENLEEKLSHLGADIRREGNGVHR